MATSVSVAVWLEKIGLPSLSPIFEIKILASYSKMQEAYVYAKLKGEISHAVYWYIISAKLWVFL